MDAVRLPHVAEHHDRRKEPGADGVGAQREVLDVVVIEPVSKREVSPAGK